MEIPTKPTGRREEPPPPEHLGEVECLRLLRSVEVGRLAVRLSDGGVDVFPVNFVIDDGTVLFCTAAGTKLSSIQVEPIVAFEADHFDWYERTAWSVVVKGTTVQVTDPAEILELRDGELEAWQHDRKPFFVRITNPMITGRRFTVRRRIEP
ncbi:MAG: pyridoxamine 5'-phosphate oxidase family protein [Ilumatobacter sp.]|uniref:pyridoxamine 5'-phosphate oxidase family protein n=1 Tax=Ilumatobacter sp. TaxID=1967498 RepID=UPI00391A78DA